MMLSEEARGALAYFGGRSVKCKSNRAGKHVNFITVCNRDEHIGIVGTCVMRYPGVLHFLAQSEHRDAQQAS